MVLKLRKALLPLHVVSKLLCIEPFSLRTLSSSKAGSVITLFQAIGYSTFHILSSNRDFSLDRTTNMVRQMIDSYNRFSGFCAFCVLVVASILIQRKIVNVIQNLEEIDSVFQNKLNVSVDNVRWRRNVFLQMCLLIGALTFFEYRNCLMYIQDSVPFSEYCIFMCLVPMSVIGITEVQFFAYQQLICHRLSLVNKILIDFGESAKSNENLAVHTAHEIGRPKTHSFENNSNRANENAGTFRVPRNNDMRKSKKTPETIPISTATAKVNPMTILEFHFDDQIVQIQCIYSKLERTMKILKSAFSPHLVIILAMKFTTLTSLLYYCCMVIIKIISGVPFTSENADELFSTSVWICSFFAEIFLICFSCTITLNEAKKIGSNFHHFALKLDNIHTKTKVKAFSVQLLSHGIEIEPFGLFKLNLGFVYGLVGAVCTYLIILIQFDMAQKAQQNNVTSTTPNP